ncbi:MAG: OsmC family protein [Tannerellaceae bacterium]
MSHSISLNWKGGMEFESSLDNHKITLDTTTEWGGNDKGPSPKKLMLVALAGCTGMDVVSLLKKMHVEYAGLSIFVEATLTTEHPKQYNSMHLIYEFTGNNLPVDKLQKVIDMSLDRYCGVAAVYKKVMPLTYEIKIK